MRIWIFSDLHLTSSHSDLYRSLLKILEEPRSSSDHVVFSGDIFDLLVGNSPYYRHKFSEFFSAVKRLNEQKVNLHYIEGNHDFNLAGLFPSEVRFEASHVILEDRKNQKKIYIAHGDLVDPADFQYLRLRRFFRSSFFKFFIRGVPGVFIERIGQIFSRPESQKIQDLPEHWSHEKRNHLRQIFRNFAGSKKRQGFDYVVLGHCHDLDEVLPYYFNMGYPPEHRQFLSYETNAESGEEILKRRNFPGI